VNRNVELTRQQRAILIRFVATMLVSVLALFVMTLLSSYQTRVAIVNTQRSGCERGKLDRSANARAWREAEKARTRDGDLDTAAIYKSVAEGLEKRSKLKCSTTFPDPPFVKFLGVSP
jgi:hypothetical protein